MTERSYFTARAADVIVQTRSHFNELPIAQKEQFITAAERYLDKYQWVGKPSPDTPIKPKETDDG